MKVSLIDEKQYHITIKAATLDTIFKFKENIKEDIFLLGSLYYFDNGTYCDSVKIIPQIATYSETKIEEDEFLSILETANQENNGIVSNFIIHCKPVLNILSSEEQTFKKIMTLYGEGYYMVVDKDNDFQINYYNFVNNFKIENIKYSIDVSGTSDLSKLEIEDMINNNLKIKKAFMYDRTLNDYNVKNTYEKKELSELAKNKPDLKELM